MLHSLTTISEVLVQLIIDDMSLNLQYLFFFLLMAHKGMVYLITAIALDLMKEYQPYFTDE